MLAWHSVSEGTGIHCQSYLSSSQRRKIRRSLPLSCEYWSFPHVVGVTLLRVVLFRKTVSTNDAALSNVQSDDESSSGFLG